MSQATKVEIQGVSITQESLQREAPGAVFALFDLVHGEVQRIGAEVERRLRPAQQYVANVVQTPRARRKRGDEVTPGDEQLEDAAE